MFNHIYQFTSSSGQTSQLLGYTSNSSGLLTDNTGSSLTLGYGFVNRLTNLVGKLLNLVGGKPEHLVHGVGDLYVTVFGGRTRMIGTLLGRGLTFEQAMEELKEKGLWFVCADMDGDVMYRVNLKGPIGLVIGNEGEGVGRLVKETCDMMASIPMKGDIDSLNASVAAGVLAYEIVRQRMS